MRRTIPLVALAICLSLLPAACGSADEGQTEDPSAAESVPGDADSDSTDGSDGASDSATDSDADSGSAAIVPAAEDLPTLRISAIPDQDPEILDRLFGDVAAYLGEALNLKVEYIPVIDYAASVTAFKVGDLDLVWFGGLTGVQARLQVPGAMALAQRDIDADFRSVFIAGKDLDIEPFDEVGGLAALAGHRFSFGSESSTSGRLMPQYFMQQSGLSLADLEGEPGFSGSHDNTLSVVASGSYEVGALNGQVWESRSEEGAPDVAAVKLLFTTPPYYDYHWVLHPETLDRYGDDFAARVLAAFEGIDGSDAGETAILEAFKAGSFIPTENANYQAIEAVGREIGLISD